MAADLVHRDTRREFLDSVVKFDTIGENFSHHCEHIALAEWNAQRVVTHAAAGGVSHLGILDVIARIGEKIIIAGMIPVHVSSNHMIDFVRLYTEGHQSV